VYQREKLSMNRAVGDLPASASVTRWMLRAIVLSLAAAVTRTSELPSVLMKVPLGCAVMAAVR